MAKLIDRDPTPVQVRAGQIGVTTTCAIAIYQAMYDATPEMKQEPFGYVREIRPMEWKFSKTTSWGPEVWKPVFTLPIDAQAEIAKRDARIAELEQDLQTTADALGHAHQNIERLERESSACDLLEEQKGTIKALNWALGGEESTSTGNLIDAHEVDYAEEGLILLCRKLTQENVRLKDVVLFQKKAWTADFEELERIRDQIASQESSPITEEVEDIRRG